jgi:hypothetical protein
MWRRASSIVAWALATMSSTVGFHGFARARLVSRVAIGAALWRRSSLIFDSCVTQPSVAVVAGIDPGYHLKRQRALAVAKDS